MKQSIADQEALWAFTVALFKKGSVEEWCLDWQNLWDIDISFMFWLAWLEHARGTHLQSSTIRLAMERVSVWRSGVIVPARAARRFLKPTDGDAPEKDYLDIKQHLRSVELMAERIEQGILLKIEIPSGVCRNECSNISRYLESVGMKRSDQDTAKLAEVNRLASDLATLLLKS